VSVIVATQEASQVDCCKEDVWAWCQSNPEKYTNDAVVGELDT